MRRLAVLALLFVLAGCSGDSGAPAPTTVEERPSFTLNPVLAMTTDTPCGEGQVPGRDAAEGCYELGPVAVDESAFESATAGLDVMGEDWQVNPVFRPGDPGIDTFNAIAAQCYAAGPDCPTGSIAMVFDGEVISAPRVQQQSFERDRIQIQGDFTQQEAEDLAEVIAP